MFDSLTKQQRAINNALKTRVSRDIRESLTHQNAMIDCIIHLRDANALNDNAQSFVTNMIDDFRDSMRDDFNFDITKY